MGRKGQVERERGERLGGVDFNSVSTDVGIKETQKANFQLDTRNYAILET